MVTIQFPKRKKLKSSGLRFSVWRSGESLPRKGNLRLGCIRGPWDLLVATSRSERILGCGC